MHPIFGHLLSPSHGNTGIHSVFEGMAKFDRYKKGTLTFFSKKEVIQ